MQHTAGNFLIVRRDNNPKVICRNDKDGAENAGAG
jgi:hypothetical protein